MFRGLTVCVGFRGRGFPAPGVPRARARPSTRRASLRGDGTSAERRRERRLCTPTGRRGDGRPSAPLPPRLDGFRRGGGDARGGGRRAASRLASSRGSGVGGVPDSRHELCVASLPRHRRKSKPPPQVGPPRVHGAPISDPLFPEARHRGRRRGVRRARESPMSVVHNSARGGCPRRSSASSRRIRRLRRVVAGVTSCSSCGSSPALGSRRARRRTRASHAAGAGGEPAGGGETRRLARRRDHLPRGTGDGSVSSPGVSMASSPGVSMSSPGVSVYPRGFDPSPSSSQSCRRVVRGGVRLLGAPASPPPPPARTRRSSYRPWTSPRGAFRNP